jgi:N-methylhydantoinase A
VTMHEILVGIDVGGTFTDLVVCDPAGDGTIVVKVPSNRGAPDEAVLAALAKSGVDSKRLRLIVHGTTVATNALLERRGARAAFITTAGFRDVLELGRTTRLVPNSLYDPYFRRPEPLIGRSDRRVVDERVRSDGSVEMPLDTSAMEAIGAALAKLEIESVAVGFINAYRNPVHEQAAAAILRKYVPFVTLSTEVLNEIREFERFSAAALNAYVMPVMARYIGRLSSAVRGEYRSAGFYTVASHGGLLTPEAASAAPVRTILSGPAAGVAAAVHFSRETGLANLIAYDMGGTSTDVALIADGGLPLKRETILEGIVLKVPQLDINTVSAGGGSIATLDTGGALQVGPESAGAVPGPACYGRGGEQATVTDANVLLGRLGEGQELGQSLTIDRTKAEVAIRRLSDSIAMTPESMADAIVRLAVAKMAAAVFEMSVARGHDPGDFALLSYGGAGPLHAALVAEELGIPMVVVPPAPGAFSAFGTLCSALTKDRSLTLLRDLDDRAFAEAEQAMSEMAAALTCEFRNEGVDTAACASEYQLDLRYQGQAHELTVPIAPGQCLKSVIGRFEQSFEREYGRRDSGRGVELVNARAIVRKPMPTPSWTAAGTPQTTGIAAAGQQWRNLWIAGELIACPLVQRREIAPAATVDGPAIVEEMSATTYVPPGWRLSIGQIGELRLDRPAPPAPSRRSLQSEAPGRIGM